MFRKTMPILVLMASLGIVLAGCGHYRGERALSGAGIGAGVGAAGAAVTGGDPVTGAAVGAGAGAAAGALTEEDDIDLGDIDLD